MMRIKNGCHLILASESEVRKKMLADLNIEFQVLKPDFDEEAAKTGIADLSIKEQAIFLSRGKALSISKKYPESLVIAADQICSLKNRPLNKSKNRDEAIAQLKKLSGKIHYQNNSTVLYQNGKELLISFDLVKLKMRKLTDDEINAYVDIDRSWGCAGSYKFECFGRHLFTSFKGNQDCILGINLQPIIDFLYQKKLAVFY